MHPVQLGTCGWSYKDWSGVFYPEGQVPGATMGEEWEKTTEPTRNRRGPAVADWHVFADVRHQGHESGTLDRVLDGALERGAVTAALAGLEFSLASAEFF